VGGWGGAIPASLSDHQTWPLQTVARTLPAWPSKSLEVRIYDDTNHARQLGSAWFEPTIKGWPAWRPACATDSLAATVKWWRHCAESLLPDREGKERASGLSPQLCFWRVPHRKPCSGKAIAGLQVSPNCRQIGPSFPTIPRDYRHLHSQAPECSRNQLAKTNPRSRSKS